MHHMPQHYYPIKTISNRLMVLWTHQCHALVVVVWKSTMTTSWIFFSYIITEEDYKLQGQLANNCMYYLRSYVDWFRQLKGQDMRFLDLDAKAIYHSLTSKLVSQSNDEACHQLLFHLHAKLSQPEQLLKSRNE